MIFSNLELAVIAGFIFMKGKTSATTSSYLGSEASKAYYFPWLVTIHREVDSTREFFGSGTILTPIWVISSMDSFVRRSTGGKHRPYYQEVHNLFLYSGGVWGEPYIENIDDAPTWYQKRRISEILMFSEVNTERARVETFRPFSEPDSLNTYKKSPFGFSMAICLVKVTNIPGQNREQWVWKRNTLPVPLLDPRAGSIKVRLESEIEKLEKAPFSLQCFVGGWHLNLKRLIQHKVIYVPFSQCEMTYCGYDQRACLQWPVNGVHVCFKSLTYTDVCWLDQGSALYCGGISKSAIAVLTSGPTCGHAGLPGVYTLMHHAMELYERVSPLDPYVPISKEDAKKYTPPPQKDLIPAYR